MAPTVVEIYVDPSCPWAWVTHGWLREVAPARDLDVRWQPYCLEIRDDYGAAPTVRPEHRDAVILAHALSHRMLRVIEAARAAHGDDVVLPLYQAWGKEFFGDEPARDDGIVARAVDAAGLEPDLVAASDDEAWDDVLRSAMEVAYAFGGVKTQTPTIVVREDPPHGFKGPVMASAPSGAEAAELWDAIQVLSRQGSFFEITRPRVDRPRPLV